METNVQASKEQERKALNQIRAIVESLGENSYVGTALEGCLDDAESNIENDFADSPYGRWQYAEKKLEEANAQIEEFKVKDAEKDRVIAKLGDKVAELVKNSIGKDDLETVITLTRAGMTETGADVEKYAAQIVAFADDTGTAQFCEAVRRHRQSKSCYDSYCDLLNRLCEITPQGGIR